MLLICSLLIVYSSGLCKGQSWTTDDLGLFDLVEEINGTFYQWLDVSQDASTAEIKRAYRRLSLKYHPDRNSQPDAPELFRKLASVYEVLKDEEMRQKYNDVLEFGLPDWRQPIYYYRKARKMPWWELGLICLLILTVGQYLMLWGAYFEKLLVVQSKLDRIKKKEKQHRKQNVDTDDLINECLKEHSVEKPTWRQLLPLLIVNFTVQMPKKVPVYIAPVTYDVATDLKPVSTTNLENDHSDNLNRDLNADESSEPKSTDWSVEETAHLIRLTTTKYQTGTPNRWEKIASVLRRKPEDITAMVGKLKHMDPTDYQKLSALANSAQWVKSNCTESIPSKPMEPTSLPPEDDEIWTQSQQKLFEQALQQFPKGASERWENISRCVPGKSKEECLQRFKFLAEMVRNRKHQSK